MANILGMVSKGIPQEGRDLLNRMQDKLLVFPWLKTTIFDNRTLAVNIAAIRAAPVTSIKSAAGDYSFVIGHMFPELPQSQNPAEYLLSLFTARGINAFEANGDFYLAGIHTARGELLLSTDTMGIFPLYYSTHKDSLIFSTTPSIIKQALKTTPGVSTEGLVGILLTMHMVGEQTVWERIYRAKAGHVLQWSKEGELRSHPVNVVSPSNDHFGKSLQDCQHLYHGTLADICRFPSGNIALLLSGGMDSRLVAGYMAHNHKSGFPCYTLGTATDNEFYCAAGVAKELLLSHIGIPVGDSIEDQSIRLAELQAGMESLSNGFNDLSWWDVVGKAKGTNTTLYNGFVGDPAMGGSHIPWAYDKDLDDYVFQMMFTENNKWGLTPDQINKLFLPGQLGSTVENNIETLRSMYDNNDGLPFQQAWMYDLLNRQRFHVGACIWRLSFSLWPRTPFADKRLLNLSAGMPGSTMLERWTQRNILRTKFPALAKLPLDRNSADISPLTNPSRSARIKLNIHKLALERLRLKQNETRYYYRVFDLNNPVWRSIRKHSTRCHTPLPAMLDPTEYKTLILEDRESVALEDGITGASRIKTLLALNFLTDTKL